MEKWDKIIINHIKYWERVLSEYYNQESLEYKHLTNEDVEDIKRILNGLNVELKTI